MSKHKPQPNLPVIREAPLPDQVKMMQAAGTLEPYLKRYKMGKATILVGKSDANGWHLSISRTDGYPSWDEVKKARYELIPNEAEMVMHLPPMEDYINIHEYCFQLGEIKR